MIKYVLGIFLSINGIVFIKAQEQDFQKYFVGGYYSILIEPYILESTGDSVQFAQHFINVNLRYAINHKWRIGIEYLVSLVSYEEISDPFHTFGLTVDYDVLKAAKSKLNLRLGLSTGNLLYAGDFEPKKHSVINRVIGVSYEFKISKIMWLNAGLYGHRPFNKIPYKYALVQPFIGACIGFY